MNIPQGQLVFTPVTIPINTQLSGAISTEGASLCGLMMPSALTGTAVTFYACQTLAGTYQQVFNAAGAVSYAVGASQYVAIDPKDFQGMLFLKIKSGSSELAARTIVCSMKGI